MRFLSVLLCPLIALNSLWAQTNSAGSADNPPETALHLHVVDDPGLGLTQSTAAKGYVVQITNGSGAPVAGAAVALRLPEDGATGRFANGLRAWVAYSDAAGIARFPVIQWGEHAGPVELRVTAAKGTSHTGLVIAQQIGPEHPSVSVVSVPMTAAAAPATPTAEVATVEPKVEAKSEKPALQPKLEAKPAQPRAPELALQTATPGTISKPLADTVPTNTPAINIARSGSSIDNPHTLTPKPPASESAKAEPSVSITNSPTGAGGSHGMGNKKWLVLVAVGAGAGVGAMMAMKGHGSNSGSSSGTATGVSFGTPTITIH